MYNNRLRRWHRYPFVSVGGHLGFPSTTYRRRGPKEGVIAAARRAGGDKMAEARQSQSYGKGEVNRERRTRERKRESERGRERAMREQTERGGLKGDQKIQRGGSLEIM